MEELILGKAKDLFFCYGLKSISMDDLARQAGVSKKTVYQFVADKNELVTRIAQQLVDCHRQALEQCCVQAQNAIEEIVLQDQVPFAALAAINRSFFYDLEKFFPQAWEVLMQYRSKDLQPQILRNLERGLDEGLYRADLDLGIIPQIRLQQLQSALEPGAFTTLLSDPKQLMMRLTRFYLHGITNSKGAQMIDKYLNVNNLN